MVYTEFEKYLSVEQLGKDWETLYNDTLSKDYLYWLTNSYILVISAIILLILFCGILVNILLKLQGNPKNLVVGHL